MNKTRSGFTLVELLVVITIIGILMGLLIPAVNAAREAGRKAQCAANIRNFGLGSIQYENSKGRMPNWCQSFGTFTGSVDPSDPSATAVPHVKLGTWTVALLPYLDAQATYEIWTEDKYPIVVTASTANPPSPNGYSVNGSPNLEVMQCASSPSIGSQFGRNSYVSNNGMHHMDNTTGAPFAPTGTAPTEVTAATLSQDKANGVFVNGFAGTSSSGFPLGIGVSLDDLKDGQGYTVLFSENLQAMPWHRAGFSTGGTLSAPGLGYPTQARFAQGMVWHWADTTGFNSVDTSVPSQVSTLPANGVWAINGGLGAQDKFNISMAAGNTVQNSSLARPSSAHVDGVNMAFADASVKFIQDSIDYRVYQALMTPRGKSSNVPFNEYVLQGEAL